MKRLKVNFEVEVSQTVDNTKVTEAVQMAINSAVRGVERAAREDGAQYTVLCTRSGVSIVKTCLVCDVQVIRTGGFKSGSIRFENRSSEHIRTTEHRINVAGLWCGGCTFSRIKAKNMHEIPCAKNEPAPIYFGGAKVISVAGLSYCTTCLAQRPAEEQGHSAGQSEIGDLGAGNSNGDGPKCSYFPYVFVGAWWLHVLYGDLIRECGKRLIGRIGSGNSKGNGPPKPCPYESLHDTHFTGCTCGKIVCRVLDGIVACNCGKSHCNCHCGVANVLNPFCDCGDCWGCEYDCLCHARGSLIYHGGEIGQSEIGMIGGANSKGDGPFDLITPLTVGAYTLFLIFAMSKAYQQASATRVRFVQRKVHDMRIMSAYCAVCQCYDLILLGKQDSVDRIPPCTCTEHYQAVTFGGNLASHGSGELQQVRDLYLYKSEISVDEALGSAGLSLDCLVKGLRDGELTIKTIDEVEREFDETD